MPQSTLRWQAFNQKKPYLVATVACVVGVAFVVGLLFQKLADNKLKDQAELDPQVQQIQAKVDKFSRTYKNLQATRKRADQLAAWLGGRYYWADALSALRTAMIAAEQDAEKKLAPQHPGIVCGWQARSIGKNQPNLSCDLTSSAGI